MASHPLHYRPDIDGLRAIAVLGVVFCHAGLGVPGGFVGVDVFFVISGYLIAGLILKDLERGTFSLAEFCERRIRRILPALFAVTAATLIAGFLLLIPGDYEALGKSVVGLSLMISNVWFWRETGYFAAEAESKPLLHTWSLAVEEQFYLVLPLFLLILARAGLIHRAFKWIALIAIASFALSVYGTGKNPPATFYLLPTRAWELLAGVLLALRPASEMHRHPALGGAAGILGLCLVLAPFALYDETTAFPGLAAVPPVLGAVLLIATSRTTPRPSPADRLLATPPLVFVGRISYSLYLWHWPLFAFARSQAITTLTVAQRASLVVASLALGIVSWRFIEQPFRARGAATSRKRLWQAAGLAYACLLGVGLTIYGSRGFDRRLPAEIQRILQTGRRDERYSRNLVASDLPGELTRLGTPDAIPQLLVWGDSHAMAILPAVDALCRESGIAGRAATHSSTAPAIDYYLRLPHALNERAIPFGAAVLDYVESEKLGTVLLVATWSTYFRDDAFPDALLKTVDALKARGAAVYFMKDVPVFDFDVPRAMLLYRWRGWEPEALEMPNEQYLAANRFHDGFLPRLREKGVRILDPIPILRGRTGTAGLLPFDSGGSFYFDKRHLSNYGALSLRPLFDPLIRSVRVASRPARD